MVAQAAALGAAILQTLRLDLVFITLNWKGPEECSLFLVVDGGRCAFTTVS